VHTKYSDIRDYDYLSRTLANVTEDDSVLENNEDYVYDEDEPNKLIDFTKLAKQTENQTISSKNYDKDGYLRPELMQDRLGNNSTTNRSNVTYLDDNYVLPMLLNTTQTMYVTEMPKPILSTSTRNTINSKVTVFSDSVGKQLGSNILAETVDYDESAEAPQLKQLKNVAFAPIIVLTKPDR